MCNLSLDSMDTIYNNYIDPWAVVGHFIITNVEELEMVLMFCHGFGITDYVYSLCDFVCALLVCLQ